MDARPLEVDVAAHAAADARAEVPRPSADTSAPPDAVAPAGLVPMFVAAGMGGRTITSCDDGRSWIADHAHEAGNADHSEYTHKGFAYGQGLFVMIMAWGANVSLKVSDDGVTWRRETTFDRTFYGGLAFGGGAFGMLRQGVTQMSRDGLKSWHRARLQPRADFREGGGGGEAQVGVFAGGSGAALSMSWDTGETWTAVSGCPVMDFGGVGQHGGIAFGGGNLVFVSRDGATCRAHDGGTKTSRGTLGTTRPIDGKLFWSAGRFWVLNGNEAFASDDGGVWTRQALQPREVAVHAIARGDSGTFVGVDRRGGAYYRSTDGLTWEKASGPSAGNNLLRVAFGHGKPSTMCPRR
jgi:hypothetical protein